MLDRDLAELYEVEVRSLNQAVKRNIGRFPEDFMFQLTNEECSFLRSQFVISKNYKNDVFQSQIVTEKETRGGRQYLPYAFTEHGILMLSSVLNSNRAVEVNIQIMRIFVKMREYLISQTNPIEQIAELRKILMLHIENTDNRLEEHEAAIRYIMKVHEGGRLPASIINFLSCTTRRGVLDNLIEKPPKTKRIGFT